jgi:hypothetical protein
MNPPLALMAALAEALARPLSWSDVLILRNFGALRLDHRVAGALEARGFHLLLLDPSGHGTHYVKCSDPQDASARREATWLATLRDLPDVSKLVPKANVILQPEVTVLLLAMVEGESFARRVTSAPTAEGLAEARACLEARRRLLAPAGRIEPLRSLPPDFDPLEALEPSLKVLEGWVEPRTLAAVRTQMPRRMPSAPQHGDFTPVNIIWSQGGPVFLDFESFGLVSCPLYDTWHFVRNIREERGEAGTWDTLIENESIELGLTKDQISASYVWYLAHFTALIISRHIPERYIRPYLTDLKQAV